MLTPLDVNEDRFNILSDRTEVLPSDVLAMFHLVELFHRYEVILFRKIVDCDGQHGQVLLPLKQSLDLVGVVWGAE